MAKTIAFPLNARVASMAATAREMTAAQSEALTEQQSLFEELLGFLEKNAKECLKEATLPQVEFRMDPADLKDLLLHADAWLGNHQRNFTFRAANDETEYRLILNLRSQENDEEEHSSYLMNATLFSVTDGRVQIFDYQAKQWEEDRELQKYWDYIETGEAEAEYLKGLADFFEVGLYFQSYSDALANLRENRALVRLYRMLGGLGRFEFVANGAGDLLVLLVPADPRRPGSAVQCIGEQYALCQYFSGKKAESTIPSWLADIFATEEEEKGHLPGAILGVCAERSVKKMVQCLQLWWDHYTPMTVYTIPISTRAAVQTETPWEEPTVVTIPEGRELTVDEQQSLFRLCQFLNKKN
ncbi:MAG: hypothetical protein LUF35_00715 [Lachnospiraceae bacterium]|nr:hypothetical protein [Lachnospiraceae bacterium]